VTLIDTRNHSVCNGTATALSVTQLRESLSAVPEWQLTKEQKLHRSFDFGSFVTAIEFVNAVALIAERQNHHPSLLVDKRHVEVIIWTRKLACLTVHDFDLAASIDRLKEEA
jgi:4a-hydroxytetrahydrobiopterin dehydratase